MKKKISAGPTLIILLIFLYFYYFIDFCSLQQTSGINLKE